MAPKKFDTKREPKKPRPYLMPVEWGGAWPMTMMAKAKINKKGDIPPQMQLGHFDRGIYRQGMAA